MAESPSRFQPISAEQLARLEQMAREPEHPLPTSPTECLDCGVVYYDGRWRWGVAPGHVREGRCPACTRIAQKQPAAWIVLAKDFAEQQANALQLIEEGAEHARALHPLRRLMAQQPGAEGLELSFTDMRLARELAGTLQHVFHAQLSYHYDAQAQQLRIVVTR
jgi:hypothetical protein